LTSVGQGITFFNIDPRMPYMQRWELSIQRELPGGFVAEISYVGNRGTGVEYSRNLNATPLQYLSTSPTRDQTRINYLSTNMPNPFRNLMPPGASGTFTGANISRERLLRSYPHFDSVNTTSHDGYSWYHSLQSRIDKRFSKGYTLTWNYTWSKFMQATELLNGADPRPTEVLSDLDRPHRISMSGIYELPFGRGRTFGAAAPGALSAIISGWQVSGIYAYQSGAPLGWGNIIFRGNIKDIALPSGQRTVDRWFNTDAGFEKVSANQLGSNVRTFPSRFSSLRGDIISNFDFSVIKNTRIAEGKLFQFKAEFINAFNRPQFPNPDTSPASATFGKITASTQSNYARRIQLNLKFIF
jgi:hypothetical protein